MLEGVEREMRSIRRRHLSLKMHQMQPGSLSSVPSDVVPLRVGGLGSLTQPHEPITDAILDFAQNVWHFKDYLKNCVSKPVAKIVEQHANQCPDLLIVADLANTKKHERLDNPRSSLTPRLGILDNGRFSPDVVCFDTSRSGAIAYLYNGMNKESRIWAANPVAIPYRVEVVVLAACGHESRGDAVDFIRRAFDFWEPLMTQLGILPRPECTE